MTAAHPEKMPGRLPLSQGRYQLRRPRRLYPPGISLSPA
jgi:hypothetical protein